MENCKDGIVVMTEEKVPNPPLPLMKSVRVFPLDEAIEINEDGTIEGATVMRSCRDPVHVFEDIPGHCQCGEQYWSWGEVIEMY